MAEFVASVAGIVSIGTRVSLTLYQLAADIGDAATEARIVAGEIRAFCSVVKTLGETLENIHDSQYYAHCANMTKEMTDASLEMFSDILKVSHEIRSMSTKKDGRFGFMSRVQWAVFQKPRIVLLRGALESYKSNLTLMLGTLNTVEKVNRRIPRQNSMEIQTIGQNDGVLQIELEQEARVQQPLPGNDSLDDVYRQLQQMPVWSLGGRNVGLACRALRAKRRRH